MEKSKKKRVIVIGGGFAGVSVVNKLASQPELEVLLIDRRNYHLFQPLLYQVAMAGLNPADIAVPLRTIFSRHHNVQVILGEVKEIDRKKKAVFFDGRWEAYDTLVVACGAKHHYFGNEDWEKFAPGLKTIEQATEIRRRILTAFENAEKAQTPEEEEKFLTFVVVEGAPQALNSPAPSQRWLTTLFTRILNRRT